jgi:cyclopropane-fatty-acyl-phospholipid synthase
MDALTASEEITRRLSAIADGAPRVRAWNGEEWGPADATATLVLRHPGALRAALLPPNDLNVGEAYIYDDIDIEGSIHALIDYGFELDVLKRKPWKTIPIALALRRLPDESRRAEADRPRFRGRRHSRWRDRKAVRHHYDTGNEFYEQFLDPLMVYSCGYFLDPSEDLETAQRRKLDVICRKLQLAPGQRLLDVGCGWGALVVHAAEHYGVEAVGVTISPEQVHYATRRVKAAGLEDRIKIVEADYREIKDRFNAIASIGMFEHVGQAKMATYFRRLRSMLEPGGALLNHTIVDRRRKRRRRREATFVNTYVFPDGELIPVEDIIAGAENEGFELRDVESLRRSYSATLRNWVANLERNADTARELAGEVRYRTWRLYMAGSVKAFDTGGISVYQLLCTDPERPWTYGRSGWLAGDDR